MSSGLARVGAQPISQWQEMREQADTLVKSGFLPNHIKTAEQAIAVMMTGDDLGIPKMLALRSINVINGKPSLSADLMASLVMREIDRHKDGRFTVTATTPKECRITYRRWGEREEQEFVFTEVDARTAGLWGKAGPWTQHPAQMLRARATSIVCRMAFADVVAGLYTPDELLEGEPIGHVEVGPIVELVPTQPQQRRGLRDRRPELPMGGEVVDATPTNAELQDRDHDVVEQDVLEGVVIDEATGKPVDDDAELAAVEAALAGDDQIVNPITGELLPKLHIVSKEREDMTLKQLRYDIKAMTQWLGWTEDALKGWTATQRYDANARPDMVAAHAALEDMVMRLIDD